MTCTAATDEVMRLALAKLLAAAASVTSGTPIASQALLT